MKCAYRTRGDPLIRNSLQFKFKCINLVHFESKLMSLNVFSVQIKNKKGKKKKCLCINFYLDLKWSHLFSCDGITVHITITIAQVFIHFLHCSVIKVKNIWPFTNKFCCITKNLPLNRFHNFVENYIVSFVSNFSRVERLMRLSKFVS